RPTARRRARLRQADARRGAGAGRPRALGAGGAREREADHGLRPPCLPGRGPTLAHPQADGEGARLAAGRSGGAARAGRAEGAPGAPSRARPGDERRVLLGDRARCRRDPAAARARDVRVLAGGRLVGAHRRAEAHRPPVQAVGPVHRPRRAIASLGVTLAEAAALALLHTLANADDNAAVRRLAVLSLRHGSPQRDTIVLLHGIAEEDGLERGLREQAAKVAGELEKRAKTR